MTKEKDSFILLIFSLTSSYLAWSIIDFKVKTSFDLFWIVLVLIKSNEVYFVVLFLSSNNSISPCNINITKLFWVVNFIPKEDSFSKYLYLKIEYNDTISV